MDYYHIEQYFDYFNKHAKEGYEVYKDDINDVFTLTQDVYEKLANNDSKTNKKDYQKAFEKELFHRHLPHDVFDLAVESLQYMIRLMES